MYNFVLNIWSSSEKCCMSSIWVPLLTIVSIEIVKWAEKVVKNSKVEIVIDSSDILKYSEFMKTEKKYAKTRTNVNKTGYTLEANLRRDPSHVDQRPNSKKKPMKICIRLKNSILMEVFFGLTTSEVIKSLWNAMTVIGMWKNANTRV